MPAPAGQLVQRGMQDSSRELLEWAIKEVKPCTDQKGKGIALWIKTIGSDGLPLILPEDAILEDVPHKQSDPIDWSYRARLATLGAWSKVGRQVSTPDLADDGH